jgi:hypothetical protein
LNASPLEHLRRAYNIALRCALCFWVAATPVLAGPRIEDFTVDTWAQWQKLLPRPAIVVFSTTYCPTCPEVFAELAAQVKRAGTGVALIAVVMDPEGLQQLPHLQHYRAATQVFVFRGAEPALRFSVDPHWRGVTPFVALFGTSGPPRLAAGRPAQAQVDALLAPR